MEVNNFGDALLPGQKPTSKKGGSIHLNMFEGLKDAVVGGGTFTCGGRVYYFTLSSGESFSGFTSFVSRLIIFGIGGNTPGEGI